MLKRTMLIQGTVSLLFFALAACGKKDDDEKKEDKTPSDVIFGAYTLTSYKETKTDCTDPTTDVAPAPATFAMEALPDGETGEDTAWFEAEGFTGRFAFDTKTAEGVWAGVPSKGISGFSTTCLLFYNEQTAKLEGDVLTLESRRYSGEVTNTAGGDCTGAGKLDAMYAEHKGKLACKGREVLVAKKAP